jgi:hypothetical protein
MKNAIGFFLLFCLMPIFWYATMRLYGHLGGIQSNRQLCGFTAIGLITAFLMGAIPCVFNLP